MPKLEDYSTSALQYTVPLFTVMLLLLPLLVNGCAVFPKIQLQSTTHFQTIKWPILRDYLLNLGYKDGHDAKVACGDYYQSADGKTLYIPDGDLRTGLDYSLLLINADNPKLQRVTRPKYDPHKSYWIDPAGKVRFLPAFAFPEFGPGKPAAFIDDQSGLFFQWTDDGVVHVGKMNSATGWLFSTSLTGQFHLEQICACGEIIYLLDHSSDNSEPSYMFSRKNCWAFAPDPKNSATYIKIDEFSVPGTVELADPFSPRFVCRGYSFAPLGGGCRLLYDASKHKVITTLAEDEVVLFLSDDWLIKRLSNGSHRIQ